MKYISFIRLRHPIVFSAFSSLLIFMCLGWFRFAPAFLPGQTIASPGDGWGTVAYFYDWSNAIEHKGPQSLFGGFYYSEGIGAGLNLFGHPSTFLQRLLAGSLGLFLAPDDIYDTIGFLSFVLIGWTGYLLAYHLTKIWFVSMIAGFLMMMVPSFEPRVLGHLFLSVSFPALVTLLFGFRYIDSRKTRDIVGLAVSLWITFMLSQYYGYFLCWILLAIGGVSILLRGKILWKERRSITAHFALFGAIFVSLMISGFPEIFLPKIQSLLGSTALNHGAQYNVMDFEFASHSANQPLAILRSHLPSLAPLNEHLPEHYGETPSFTTGLIMPLSILLSLILALVIPARYRKQELNHDLNLYFIACIAAIVVSCLVCLHPDSIFSLVNVTRVIAPMLRGSVRILLFTEMLTILCFAIVLTKLWRALDSKMLWLKSSLFAGIGMLTLIFVVPDMSGFGVQRAVSPLPTASLPDQSHYRVLKPLPKGILLEIPFHYPEFGFQEDDYFYMLARVEHGKDILNGGLSFSNDAGIILRRIGGYLKINLPSDNLINELRGLGVRYLSVHEDKGIKIKEWLELEGIRVISKNQSHALLEIEQAQSRDLEKIAEWLWPETYRFPIASLPSALPSAQAPPNLDTQGFRILRHEQDHPYIILYGPYIALDPGTYSVSIKVGVIPGVEQESPVFKLEVPSQPDLIVLQNQTNQEPIVYQREFTLTKGQVVEVKIIALRAAEFRIGDLEIKTISTNSDMKSKSLF